MKLISISLAALAALALAGCDDGAYDRVHRSKAVLSCGDGTVVGRDPETGGYVFTQNARGWYGDLAPGVDPALFCAGVRK